MELEKLAHKLFEFLDPQNSKILSGKKIFPLFSSSGLPTKTLARVWEISAQGKKGIDVTQFELALRIISLAQSGIPLNKMKEKCGRQCLVLSNQAAGAHVQRDSRLQRRL